MFSVAILTKLIISIALGVLIGLEREQTYHKNNTETFAGIRTFGLISMFGFLIAMVWQVIDNSRIIWIALFVIAILTTLSSYLSHKKNNSLGITTEIWVFICFLVWVLVFFDYQALSVAIAVITFAIFSLREKIHNVANTISSQEIYDSLKFAIIAFIILPVLPNQDFWFLGIFNPYKIWLMVVFVSWIWFVWYILTKVVGTKKWIWLTWLIGWIVSSTALTSSLSWLSKKTKNLNPLVFGVLISSSIMFIRVWIEIFVFNKELFWALLTPLWVMAITWILISIFYYFKKEKTQELAEQEIQIKSPFALKPALFFGAFFAFIIFLSKISLEYLPHESIYIVSFLSGFADVDAITLSIASLKQLSLETATIAIMIAVMVNTAIKWVISFVFGERQFAKKIIIAISLVIIAGIASLCFL